MGRQIIDFLSEFIEIVPNSIWNNILFMAFVIPFSGCIAFTLTRKTFDEIGFYNSKLMSIANTIFTVISFLIISFALTAVLKFLVWLINIGWWGKLAIFVGIPLIIIGSSLLYRNLSSRH